MRDWTWVWLVATGLATAVIDVFVDASWPFLGGALWGFICGGVATLLSERAQRRT